MADIVWNPNKGESDGAYINRVLNENPSMSLYQVIRARTNRILNPVIKKDDIPKMTKTFTGKASSRELELEEQLATLRLEKALLIQRVEMLGNMCKNYQEELEKSCSQPSPNREKSFAN